MTQEQVHRINEAFRELQQATFEAGAAFNCTVIGMIDGGKLLLVSSSMVSKAATDGSPKVYLALPIQSTIGKPITVEVTPKAAPKWQTGLIPEPTGPSVLVLETKTYADHIAIIQQSNSWFYEGERWRAQVLHSYIVMLHEFFTGRWYVHPLTLPATQNND